MILEGVYSDQQHLGLRLGEYSSMEDSGEKEGDSVKNQKPKRSLVLDLIFIELQLYDFDFAPQNIFFLLLAFSLFICTDRAQ